MRKIFGFVKRGFSKIMDKVEVTKEVVGGLFSNDKNRKIAGSILIGVGIGIVGFGCGMLASGYIK